MLGAVVEPRARRDKEQEVDVDHPSKALHADSTMNSCGGTPCRSIELRQGSHPRRPQVVSRLGLGLVVVVHRDGDFVSPYRDDLAVERRERAVDVILRREVQPNPPTRSAGVTCTEVNPFSLPQKSLVGGFHQRDRAMPGEVAVELPHDVPFIRAQLPARGSELQGSSRGGEPRPAAVT